MEPAQINQAQDEYDATIGDQPSHMLTDYELASKLDPDHFHADQGDYLICESLSRSIVLQTYINSALKAEQDGNIPMARHFAKDVGQMIIENFANCLRDLDEKGLL